MTVDATANSLVVSFKDNDDKKSEFLPEGKIAGLYEMNQVSMHKPTHLVINTEACISHLYTNNQDLHSSL